MGSSPDKKVFLEPEKFIPERWLESSEEKLVAMERSIFALGGGSRICIGRHISIVEMMKVIPQC